jgi:hypothetical protein
MANFRLYTGLKDKEHAFIDSIVGESLKIAGTIFHVYKYIGPVNTNSQRPNLDELTIQDVVLQENRDRKYDSTVYEIPGSYQLDDAAFNMSAFGLMINGEMITPVFHTTTMIKILGRKLMPGDVIEAVHQRDDTSLSTSSAPIPKFFVIQDASRPAEGYGPNWQNYLWKVSAVPMPESQEYRKVIEQYSSAFDEILKDIPEFGPPTTTGYGPDSDAKIVISSEHSEQTATNDLEYVMKKWVSKHGYDPSHFYIKIGDKTNLNLIPWYFSGDGVPQNYDEKNGIVRSGETFPENPKEGDYFLRTDNPPERLYVYHNNKWKLVETNRRREWIPASRLMEKFIQNRKETVLGPRIEDKQPTRQALSSTVPNRTKGKKLHALPKEPTP